MRPPPTDSDKTDGPSWWYRNRQRRVAVDDAAIRAFLEQLDDKLAKGREFAVLIASDEAVRTANRQFRGLAKSTDVLSFPDDEDGPGGEGERLGDILISAKRAALQATELGHSVEEEVKTLILHGLLHLLGWDHEMDSGEMAAEEKRWRRKLGLAAGLIERTQ
ncbi:MAG: rRNA maturation RNase YbeY [Acidobacteria bacterium]|nr:rRNA maturation RNase YbeY [Acidobacteriota bacterium]